MSRIVAAFLACSLAIFASAAPVPEAGSKLYYPTKIGTKWVYSMDGKKLSVVLSAVEVKDGATVITLVTEEGNGKTAPLEIISLSEKGVFRVSALGEKIDPPLCLLKMPATPGNEWETGSRPDELESKGKHKIFGPEEIEVPAGKYKVIRVESEVNFTGLSEPLRYTDWYALGVGCIKSVRGESVTELTAFTPGKK
jgi:hypothetical protein